VDAMLGELLGTRYKVIEILGAGGFGHTYIAEDSQRPGNPRCVLKHLTFASSNPMVLQQVRRLFQAEAETLERLGRHDQIPRLLAYFEQNQEFYLVQEFIAGHPLSEELHGGIKLSESQTMAVLEDVLGILQYVHAEGVIHRDIKPENLIRRQQDNKLVLIDFGAVKAIGNTVAEAVGETHLSMPIYTSGYSAGEQCLGRPQFSSDLYSLGMVAIQMLTGLRPSQLPQDFNTSELIWQDQVQISGALTEFLSQMTRYHHVQRYQSATEALQALHLIMSSSPTVLTEREALSEQLAETSGNPTSPQFHPTDQKRLPRRTRSNKLLALAGLAVTTTIAVVLLVRNGFQAPSITGVPLGSGTPTQPDVSHRISAGEKLLDRWQINPNKQEGIERIASGEYVRAVSALEIARQRDRSDPEILIYLNNARIGTGQSYKIATIVPLGDTFGSAMEILRGVAQAQDEVNQAGGINHVPLRVAIANDDNQPTVARQLATTLASDPEILGVVGHGISDTALAAAEIYQKQGLVMVAPLSSAVQLSNAGSYIFRTMPSDRLTAKALVGYMLTRLKKRKAVVFFNSASTYSTSLKNEFRDALFYNDVDLLDEYDFSRPDFDPYESVEQAVSKRAEVIMLAADSNVSDRALLVVKLNRRRLQLLGGDSISTSKILRVSGKEAVGMVLAVPTNLSGSPFQHQSLQIWGKTASVSWRTALAYDATKAIIAGLRKDPTRSGTQRVLSQPDFSTDGSIDKIRFLPSGDRQGSIHLMTVAPIAVGQPRGYDFKSLK
jgi:ABC-type branched-subunit amino acid transport system substrate-binding protein/predicted Ser/Thr protein kinase